MTWGSYLVARGPAGAGAVLHLHHRDDGVRVVGWRGPRRVGESLGDDALAFLDEGGEELLLGDDANDLALAEDRALALAGGAPVPGAGGLAGAVDDAAHYGDGEGLAELLEVRLHLVGEGDKVDLDAAAGGAGDDCSAPLPEVEGA